MGMIDLKGPDGTVKKVHTDIANTVKKLIEQGYKPANEISWNELNKRGYSSAQIGDVSAVHVNPYTQSIGDAQQAADQIMSGYRDFGADNELLNRSYGQDNPYLEKAMSGIQNLENIANTKGPTEYAKNLLDEQNILKQLQGEDLSREGASQRATAYNSLAESGGLDTGARERLAQSGMEQGVLSRQRLGSQDALARSGILSQDTAYKQQLAQDIPGMYNPYAQGMESWNQQLGLAKETYNQNRENQRYSTIGNIYGQEKV